MSHDLLVERLGSGIVHGECSCGAWEMRAGADAASVREESEEDLVRRNHRRHVRAPAAALVSRAAAEPERAA